MPKINYHLLKIWILHLAAILCLIVLPWQYFAASLVLYFFMMPIFQLIFHDWICHEYCKPKNQFLEKVMLLIFYTHDNNVRDKKNYHIFHHTKWNTPEEDPTYRKLEGVSLFRYIIGFQKNLDLGIYNKNFSILEKLSIVQWLDKYSRLLYISWISLIFLLFPLSWFIIICVFYPWILYITSCYHDYYLHGPIKNHDRNWTAIMFGHGAWHYAHHENWRDEYYGPGLWRIINPAWYVRQLLFVKT